MASTNKTTNYNLPQWVADDHPTFLGDFNDAFETIDSTMHANATAASTAQSTASSAQTTAESAQSTASSAQTTAESAQATASSAMAAAANATRVGHITCEMFDNMYIMVGNQPPEE